MLSVHSFEYGFRDGDGHFVLKAVDNDSLCCKKQQQQTYIARVKKTLVVMKAGKNDESNGTTVYIESSLEINRDKKKKKNKENC